MIDDVLARWFAGFKGTTFTEAADHVRAQPQTLIDALVEAGVLEQVDELTDPAAAWKIWYRLPEPHVHEWHVRFTNSAEISLVCNGCDKAHHVPNRLPIEVPDA